MSRIFYPLSIAFALAVLAPTLNASPLITHGLIAAPASDVQEVRAGRGGRGGYRGAAVSHRGAVAVGHRGAVAVGHRGAEAVGHHGAVAVGRRYHGGIWYGTGRRYWHGRWWVYGVGSCWRLTDIGYVWICG